MKEQVIEVTISPQGETTVKTLGYTGPACAQASRFLEQALGETIRDQRSAEYYQEAPATQEVQP
jgi:hypothetical protein